jgi:Mce-associated membrane protein
MPSKVTSKPAEVADSATEDTAESTTPDTTAASTVAESATAESATAESATAGASAEAAPAEAAPAEVAAGDTAVTEDKVASGDEVESPGVTTPETEEPRSEVAVTEDKVADGDLEDKTAEDKTAAESAAESAGEVAEPDAAPTAARAVPRRRRQPSRWTMLVAGLSVLVVALWVAGGVLFAHNRAASQLTAQRQDVVAAAQKVAGDLTSISSTNAQAQIQSLTSESTGSFRDQISTYAQALQAILQQSGAGSQGTVSAAGVERMDANTASVLVAVSATVSNNKLPNAQPVSYRLGVQLQREGDRWLASDVAFVQ